MNKIGTGHIFYSIISFLAISLLRRAGHLSIIFFLFLFSCTQDYTIIDSNKTTPHFSSFYLLPQNNHSLKETYKANYVNDTLLSLFCPDLEISDNIIPSFEGNFISVKVGDEIQMSGYSSHDFNNVIEYHLLGVNDIKSRCNVIITTFNGLPRIDIETENHDSILSRKEYVKANVIIGNSPEYGKVEESAKIRGLGNFTWDYYPKKPYKIKFNTKQSLFGLPANKDWVLLAEYADRSLLRTSYMCEVSKAIGMEWTPCYKHVDLFVNGIYLGTYVLIEQVEKGKNRIDISKDGFIIECDTYYEQEHLYFPSTISTPSPRHNYSFVKYFTFKHPNTDDKEIVEGDDNYKFIQNYIKEMESSILLLEEDFKCTDYLNYIDISSFAKWFIVMQLTSNYDPNYYFVLPSKKDKIKMYPVWDGEWSLGAWSYIWGKEPVSLLEDKMAERMMYFPWLIKSPTFIQTLQAEWKMARNEIDVSQTIEEIFKYIRFSSKTNFDRWEYVGDEPYWRASTWEEEVDYVREFFKNRLSWMEKYINGLSWQNQ